MNVKDTINTRYIDYKKDMIALEADRSLSPEEYGIQEKALLEKYGIDLSSKAALKYLDKTGKGWLSIDDDEQVKYLMTKSERAERRAERWENFKELWREAGPGILQEMTNQIGNVYNALSQTDPNSQSANALAEKKALNELMNKLNEQAWLDSTAKMVEMNKKIMPQNLLANPMTTNPGEANSKPSLWMGKQGMKIEYMNLFK